MFSLGLVQNVKPVATTSPPTAGTGLQLHLEDTLASARRLWVRGRLVIPAGGEATAAPASSWWVPWWKTRPAPAPAPTVHLETEVSGRTSAADTTLQEDGRFEASFDVDLPVVRRGWRVARHGVRVEQHEARACSVVLQVPTTARAAVVVVLPAGWTLGLTGSQRFAGAPEASRLAGIFQELQKAPGGDTRPLYYLACGAGEHRQAELALAATTQGWPAGHFVLLPPASSGITEPLLHALDRLRWLFAGTLELQVLNLEPSLAAALPAAVAAAPDRAAVVRAVNVNQDPAELLDGPRPGPVVPRLPALRPTHAARVPRYPVVFCHGILAVSIVRRLQLPEEINYLSGLRPFLQERGVRALFPRVAPMGGVEARARQLLGQINAWTDGPVNLVTHSMGGLDARYLITHMGMAGRVRSLTTIAAPHHGSYIADWIIANFRQGIPLLLTLEAFGVDVNAFRDCRPTVCREFNSRTPDMPGVRYFSYGAAVPQSRVSPMLRRAWNLLSAAEGPNDGLVSEESARWGEYLGTLAVDHFAQSPDGLFVRPCENFDSVGFFTRLIEDLAWRGF
jgi:triacylglycerol lipase